VRRPDLETIISSLDAHKHLRATMTACSWRAGWRSLLIRAYEDPAEAEEFVTPATRDHLIVLVTGGSCDVEVRYRNGWAALSFRAGSHWYDGSGTSRYTAMAG
jgi:AraC family transcriptional regulator